jgi:hypothetical protein
MHPFDIAFDVETSAQQPRSNRGVIKPLQGGKYMRSVKNGIIAGLVATFVTGAVMLMNNAVHGWPSLGTGRMLAAAMGMPDHVLIGWLTYLVFAVFIWGIAFAYIAPAIPVRSYLVKGLLLAFACWLVITLIIMPLAGVGLFGANRPLTPAIALVLAIIYWSVLSLVYRWCTGPMVPNAPERT